LLLYKVLLKDLQKYESIQNIRENLEALAEQHFPKSSAKVVSIWKAFTNFAFQGNVIDLSVGIIIGTLLNITISII
jgi:hypothetical protein